MRRDLLTVCLGVALARPTVTWKALDAAWSAVATDMSASLFGGVRMYQARVQDDAALDKTTWADPIAPGPQLAATCAEDLPELEWSDGWEQRGAATRSGFAVWEPGAVRDRLRERRVLVLAPADAEERLSIWTWTGGPTGVPPVGRYFEHATRLRQLARVWDSGGAVRRFRLRVDGRATALASALGEAGLLGLASPDHRPGDEKLRELASQLRAEQFHLVTVATSARDLGREVEIAASNMTAAVRGEIGALDETCGPHLFADDQELARGLERQVDDELHFLTTLDARVQAAVAVADRHGLGTRQEADLGLALSDSSMLQEALLETVTEPAVAVQLMERVGLRRRRQPPTTGSTMEAWWREVFRLIELGALPDIVENGDSVPVYRHLLTEAVRLFPTNRTFRPLARRYGLTVDGQSDGEMT